MKSEPQWMFISDQTVIIKSEPIWIFLRTDIDISNTIQSYNYH